MTIGNSLSPVLRARSVAQKPPAPSDEPGVLHHFIAQYRLLHHETQQKFDGIFGSVWQRDPEKLYLPFSEYAFFRGCFVLLRSIAALEAWVVIPRPKGFTTEVTHDEERIDILLWINSELGTLKTLIAMEVLVKDMEHALEPTLLYHDFSENPLDEGVNLDLYHGPSTPLPTTRINDQDLPLYLRGASQDELPACLVSEASFHSFVSQQADACANSNGGSVSNGLRRSETLMKTCTIAEPSSATPTRRRFGLQRSDTMVTLRTSEEPPSQVDARRQNMLTRSDTVLTLRTFDELQSQREHRDRHGVVRSDTVATILNGDCAPPLSQEVSHRPSADANDGHGDPPSLPSFSYQTSFERDAQAVAIAEMCRNQQPHGVLMAGHIPCGSSTGPGGTVDVEQWLSVQQRMIL